MNPAVAAKILALRPAMEALIVRATQSPDCVQNPGPQEEGLMEVVRALSRPNAARYGLAAPEGYVPQQCYPEPLLSGFAQA